MAMITRILKNFITSGSSPDTDIAVLRRIKVINLIGILPSLPGTGFAVYHAYNNKWLFTIINPVVVSVILDNIFTLRKHKGVRNLLNVGAHCFIKKPFDIHHIVQMIFDAVHTLPG